jgi:hypothetical protein
VFTVPEDRFDAFSVVRFAPDTAPNEPDQVPDVIVPTDVSDDEVIPDARDEPVSADPATESVDQDGVAEIPDDVNTCPLVPADPLICNGEDAPTRLNVPVCV